MLMTQNIQLLARNINPPISFPVVPWTIPGRKENSPHHPTLVLERLRSKNHEDPTVVPEASDHRMHCHHERPSDGMNKNAKSKFWPQLQIQKATFATSITSSKKDPAP